MKWLDRIINDSVKRADRGFMQAAARNAASDAIHYYVCKRSISAWREKLDEAEKKGNQFVSLADLLTEEK